MSEVIDIVDEDALKDLLDTEDFLVVKFTAPSWCGPCRQFKPHYEKAATSASFNSGLLGRATFVSVDIDDADWAPQAYGFRGVPKVYLFSFGEKKAELQERVAPKLLSEINSHLG